MGVWRCALSADVYWGGASGVVVAVGSRHDGVVGVVLYVLRYFAAVLFVPFAVQWVRDVDGVVVAGVGVVVDEPDWWSLLVVDGSSVINNAGTHTDVIVVLYGHGLGAPAQLWGEWSFRGVVGH